MSFAEAVEATAGKYTRVLFLMGSNGSSSTTVEDYTAAVDCMLENWPDADIYMQTVPDSSTGAVATERINGVIAETVAAYEAAGETRVKLLDTNSCWDSGCYLSLTACTSRCSGCKSGTNTSPQTWGRSAARARSSPPAAPPTWRRAKAERRAAYLARYWFVVSPLER